MRFTLLLLCLACLTITAAENTLTPDERKQGYKLLWDGKTFEGWKDPAKKNVPNNAWVIENGTLKTVVQGKKFSEDLITNKQYGDYELLFDWKLSPGANTGLKYRIQQEVFLDEGKAGSGNFEQKMGRETSEHLSDHAKYTGGPAQLYTVGFEFQLLDDEHHPDGRRDASHRTGALYSFIPADKQAEKPIGEWNTSRLVLKGDHFEHWLNGVKVLEGSLKDPRVREGAEKRWASAPIIRDELINAKPTGSIALQHHGDEVWFRNIKIKETK